MDLRNAYTLKLQFATAAGRIGAINIPRADDNITDAQATTLMQTLLDSGIVYIQQGKIAAKESASLITTVMKDYAV